MEGVGMFGEVTARMNTQRTREPKLGRISSSSSASLLPTQLKAIIFFLNDLLQTHTPEQRDV